jgi:hypothetical protein
MANRLTGLALIRVFVSRFKSHEDFKNDGDARANWPRLTEENFAKNFRIVEVSAGLLSTSRRSCRVYRQQHD